MKIVFWGSDDFALVILEALSQSSHEVAVCVTHPDRPQGRGMAIGSSLIKESSLTNKIPLLQPPSLKDPPFSKRLRDYRSDLFVVAAYGRILPPEVLSLPYLCCLNVHASLLPKYRGAAPIHWAIMNGDEETGVSIMKMNAQMDAGDVFAQTKIKIGQNDTAVTVRSRLARAGADLLLKTIDSLEKNAYTLAVQDHAQATYAPKLTKKLGSIAWNKTARSIHNLVRALLPWPTAYTFYQGRLLKILETEVFPVDTSRKSPGELMELHPEGFIVATLDQGLLVKRVHPESAKPMAARSFLAGHKLGVGFRLGA